MPRIARSPRPRQGACARDQASRGRRSPRVWSRFEAHRGRHPRRARPHRVAAVIDVTLLGGTARADPRPARLPDDPGAAHVVRPLRRLVPPTKEKPTSDGCSKGRRRSDERSGDERAARGVGSAASSSCIRSRSICRASLPRHARLPDRSPRPRPARPGRQRRRRPLPASADDAELDEGGEEVRQGLALRRDVQVFLTKGKKRISCKRARQIVRKKPLDPIKH